MHYEHKEGERTPEWWNKAITFITKLNPKRYKLHSGYFLDGTYIRRSAYDIDCAEYISPEVEIYTLNGKVSIDGRRLLDEK